MLAIWKLLVVLLLTLPPVAYVAGVVVGPPDLPYRNLETPASPRPQPSHAIRPVAPGGPVAAIPQPTRANPDVLAGQGERRRARPHDADADRRAGGPKPPRPPAGGARLAVPGLTTPPAPADPGPDYLPQPPALPDLTPATPDAAPPTPYDGTTPDPQGDLLDTPTPMDQDPGFGAPAPTPPAG